MLRTFLTPKKYSLMADVVVLILIGTVIYGVVALGREWQSDFHPTETIDLSLSALPLYTLFSALRGLAAYALSLLFTLVVGYWAAKSRPAERIIIPLLDILQSIPVLGFLPGLVLGLIALFPRTNTGLELAAIIMIFTGQVWNMTFSYYSSLKAVPKDLVEASDVMLLTPWRRLLRLELPFSAMGLAWNSLMSMAGGWFFLSVAEAFTLGDREYRLPGLGAYMAEAIQEGNSHAIVLGIVAMVGVILTMDFVIWRPVLSWAHRFRLEEVPGVKPGEPLIKIIVRQSLGYRWVTQFMRLADFWQRKLRHRREMSARHQTHARKVSKQVVAPRAGLRSRLLPKAIGIVIGLGLLVFLATKLVGLVHVYAGIPMSVWAMVLRNALWTFLRVVAALVLSSLWTVPVGIWIGMSPARIRIFQPIIQILASFPAPMLYPLAMTVFVWIGLRFEFGSMFLMMLGVQWYVLFNVLAGAMRIPQELVFAAELMDAGPAKRWSKLYLPSIFPALVTGWITAAGGAWNASIVAEYLSYKGQVIATDGLGSTISVAASKADFPLLAASLTVMVITVIALNRSFWAKVYELSQTRYRMDL